MSVQIYTNNAKTVSSSVIGPSDLLIPVIDPSSFPTITGTDWALITLENGGFIEIVKLTAPGKVGNNLIVDPAGRGWEGTTPGTFPATSRVEGRITAGTLNNILSVSSTAIAAETSARNIAEAAETLARTNADATLLTDIGTEALARANADTALQNNINAEASARGTAVSNEATARSNADIALQNQINSGGTSSPDLQTQINNGRVQPGEIIAYATGGTPSGGYLQLLTVGQNVSRTTYAALYQVMLAAGFPWGVGDGSTTFGIPWAKNGYGLIQGISGGIGTDWAGQVISHTHTYIQGGVIINVGTVGYAAVGGGGAITGATGGAANYAAGSFVTFWIKY